MKNRREEIDNGKIKKRTLLTARYVSHVAVMAGLITALKFALSFLPNVEVITVLIAVFSTVWGLKYSLPAVIVFCFVEMAIYGIGSWVPLYFIYWPLLAVIFHFALRGKKPAVAMGIALGIGVLFTPLFGVLSASTETLFVLGVVAPDMLDTFFVSYYLKGLWFDLVHTVSVVVSVLVLYIPLVKISERIVKGIHNASDTVQIDCDIDCDEDLIGDSPCKIEEVLDENFVSNPQSLSVEYDETICQEGECKLNEDEN